MANERLRRRVERIRSQILVEDLAELNKMRESISSGTPVPAHKGGGKRSLLLCGLLIAIIAAFLVVRWGRGSVEKLAPVTTEDPGRMVPPKQKTDTLGTPFFAGDTNKIMPDPELPMAPIAHNPKRLVVPDEPATINFETPVFADAAREFYQLPDEFISGTRGSADTSLLEKALKALVDRRAYIALSTLRELKDVAPATPRLDLYTAHAYFMNEDYALSEELFRDAAAKAEELERDELEWFLLLALLAQRSDIDTEMQALMDKMVSDDNLNTYKSSALLLRERIR